MRRVHCNRREPNTGNVGPKLIIDDDEAAAVDSDTRMSRPNRRVRPSANRQQDVRTKHRRRAAAQDTRVAIRC